MRIASTSVNDNLINQITTLSNQQVKLQSQVATGRKMTQAEDDPAAMGRVLILQTQQSQIDQYARNADHALSISQASFSGLTTLKKMSDRANQIATLSSSTNSADAQSSYASELNQMIEQAVQTGNSKFGDDYLYAGTAVSAPAFSATRDASGNVTAVSYDGNTAQAVIPLSDSTSVAPTTDGTTNQGIGGFIGNLISLRDALNSGSAAGITAAQTSLIDSENLLVTSMAGQGAIQTRIEANQSQQKDIATSLTSLVSSDTDADLATTATKLSQTQTAYQAALQSTASLMKLSLLNYIQ